MAQPHRPAALRTCITVNPRLKIHAGVIVDLLADCLRGSAGSVVREHDVTFRVNPLLLLELTHEDDWDLVQRDLWADCLCDD